MTDSTSSSNNNESRIEKIISDLFDYRLDIKSYIRNLNTIIISASILISLLAFFGYNKIEAIQNRILDEANSRLSETDKLLAQIDQSHIDSLNTILKEKESELELTIANFEKILVENKFIEDRIFETLPENKHFNTTQHSFVEEVNTSYFTIRSFKKLLSPEVQENLYLNLDDFDSITENDYLSVKLYAKGRNILVYHQDYKIESKFNKLSFKIVPFKEYKEYKLEVALFKDTGKKSKGDNLFEKHIITEIIKLKE